MNTSDSTTERHRDAVEDLLSKAAPRPMPPPEVESEVRSAVRQEWLAVSGRSRRWKTGRNIAAAATVLLAVLVALTSLRQVDVPAIEVAELERSFGTLRLIGGDTETTGSTDLSNFMAGQVLQTGADSAAGLRWHGGGSLRVDQRTRVEFVSAGEVYLHAGRIYFDSVGDVPASNFAVHTSLGVVSHVGTQFMTETQSERLVVSVREGRVHVGETAYEQAVHRGQRAEFKSGGRPQLTNTSGIDAEWAWVEAVAPSISVDGMSAYDFLQWVGRETGYAVEFTVAAEQTAKATELRGAVNKDPRTELRLRMLTMDLDARFDAEGARILVSE